MHPLAGRPAPPELLIDVARLERDYYTRTPNLDDPTQMVAFGTSGHRGTPFDGTFTEAHILAITQAIAEYRAAQGIGGPLFLGKDTHAASHAAERTALEVLAANGVQVVCQRGDGYTPTPVISRQILTFNTRNSERGTRNGMADGIVITPSHNPPQDGGFKYNPPNGGPADTEVTGWIQQRANALLREGNRGVRRISWEAALAAPTTRQEDLAAGYIDALDSVIDFEPIRRRGLSIGVDPLGGSSLEYWARIAERYGFRLTVVNPAVDPTFRFMSVDHDGKIRMDCSSPQAMAGLVRLKDQYDIAFGSDPDADRHGIVTPSSGLLNPNHYLAVAIHYLLTHRTGWSRSAKVGKTLVSSALIDRVVAELGRELLEVPVGFKWFTPGLFDGSCCFGGEESAGASFLRRDGSVWTTDKDGLLLCLLAAEITAVTGKDPGLYYRELTARLGAPVYTRIDTPCTPSEKAGFKRLTADAVKATTLAGDPIAAKLTHAPGNGAPIGGLKVTTANGWFAARPSGTENVYKLYAESFRDAGHLTRIVDEARGMLNQVLAGRS
ncbi:MAG TPA: phosphoglucomutase (alpha-D-glucose-1,6-bisphosphate-dependent) [Gemmatimonadales bacterium]|nr:phosphoglucomutase (alpha-D-glucose-1,6-bisphosphate-dependent) [Gemmatimonadales bacterium]